MAKNPFTLVPPTPLAPAAPPRTLGQSGLSLWNSIQTEYGIADSGGMELLLQACEAADRVASLAAQIATDGAVIYIRSTPKAHPALKDELANRAFVARSLQRLGVLDQSIKPIGRPPSKL